jgi:HlyD family secretion protein
VTSQKVVDSSNKSELTDNRSELTERKTEHVILLKRPVFWSYIIASLILGAGIAAGVWAALARFDQKVLATGTLEMQAPLQGIHAPAKGVVQEIYVKEGEEVEKDEPLVTFKPSVTQVELESLKKQKETLTKQNQLYEYALKGTYPANESELPSLIQLRTQLEKEIQYYQTLVTDKNLESEADGELHANQQRLLAASSPELQARVSTARSQIQEKEKQLSQVKAKLAAAQKRLAFNQDLLEQMTQGAKEVDVSRQQYQRQKQEVLNNQEEVDRLSTQQQRLTKEIARTKEELQNSMALSGKDVLKTITQNQKQIAQIDSQVRQAQQENQKQIAQIDAKLNALTQPKQLKAPVEGVVFDLRPSAAGYIANANQTLLTVVPNNSLVASVFLKDREVGIVKEGMDVQVKSATFPKSELGSVEGKVLWVGSEVLPPVAERPYYAIPAKIELERPFLQVNGKPIRLQSGMAVNGEIILPQQRTAWDILQNKFDKKAKNLMELLK